MEKEGRPGPEVLIRKCVRLQRGQALSLSSMIYTNQDFESNLNQIEPKFTLDLNQIGN